VTSYVIARTLGDPTASTSHKSSFATQPLPNSEPQIPNDNDTDDSIPAAAADPVSIPIAVLPPEGDETPPSDASTKPLTLARAGRAPGTSSLPTFFVDCEGSEDDGAARLAGVGVFSPVASMPGSPVTSRRNILEKESSEDAGSGSEESGLSVAAVRCRTSVLLRDAGRGEAEAEQEGGGGGGGQDGHGDGRGRERSASDGGSGSTSGESSFAILDREESFEDAGAHIRRRVPGTASDDE
jgi:hypothetical protein